MISLLLALAIQTPVYIGYPTDLLPATKQFPGLERVKVYPPVLKGKWVTAYKGQPEFKPGKYILCSDDIVPNPDGWPYSPQGQMVEIQTWVDTEVGTRKGFFPHDQHLETHWRGKAAWLVKAPIIDGYDAGVVKVPTVFSCIDNLIIRGVSSPDGWNAAAFIELNFCRNVWIVNEPPNMVGAPVDVSPGRGYLIKVQRTVMVNAQGLRARRVRHGFEAFGGANLFCGSMEIIDPAGSVAGAHGMGTRALYLVGTKSNGGNIAIGNKSAYGDEAEIWMSEGQKNLWLHGPSSVKVYYSVFNGPLSFERNGYGEPKSAYAYRSTFTGYSNAEPVHYQGSGPWTIVPSLEECVLKRFQAVPSGG